jgi:thiol:disulfide interchange protein
MNRLTRFGMLLSMLILLFVTACGASPAPTPTALFTDEAVEGEVLTMTPVTGKLVDQKDFAPSDPALVGKTGRPQVVMFFASWCEQCHQMRPIVFEAQQQFGEFIDFIYLDIDAEATKAARDQLAFNGQRPTLVFLDANGKESGRLVGVQPKDTFQKVLDPILTVG